MPFQHLKEELAKQLASQLGHPEITAEQLLAEFSVPPNLNLGQLALPCFRLSKTLGKPAGKLSMELAPKLNGADLTVTATGPYLNFKWPAKKLYQVTFQKLHAEKENYGNSTVGRGKNVALEYCSPNMAKRLAFQHIRSTLLGNTLANIYTALGYNVARINFIGDWGTQFARLLCAVEKWGKPEKFTSDREPIQAMDELLELYVRFHKEVDQNPSLLEEAASCLKRLEEHEEKATRLWEQIRNYSVKTMNQTLARMHVKFDYTEGESHYISAMATTLDDVKKQAQAKVSDGAWIVEVDGYSTPALIQKRDGTTLYLTRDIAAAIDRWERFKFERSLYVVSEQQKLHFQLLFGVLKKMGKSWSDRCEHVSFGTVLFGQEKMSTREGRVILLDDILNEAKKLALEECTKKNPDLKNKDEVAEQVGVGAVVFGELSANRTRDIEFDWKQILALDGETGPYVQYAHVRCASLLDKAEWKPTGDGALPAIGDYEMGQEEEALILVIARFRSVLEQCTRDNEPHHLTSYLIDVAKAFSRFYYQFPVMQATDPALREMRLNMVMGTRQVLANGLKLLGIACPSEM